MLSSATRRAPQTTGAQTAEKNAAIVHFTYIRREPCILPPGR